MKLFVTVTSGLIQFDRHATEAHRVALGVEDVGWSGTVWDRGERPLYPTKASRDDEGAGLARVGA